MTQTNTGATSTRRGFLIGGGAALGLVVAAAVWPRETPLNLSVGEGETLLSGWVKIGADGQLVVVIPQAEMGQGVYTALAMLVAEEVGADWSMVSVEPAPRHPLYANRIIGQEGLSAVPGFLQGAARWAIGEAAESYAFQITGGSTSVRGFWQPMQEAGAAARVLLCKAAARQWNVDWRDCDTEAGQVVYNDRMLDFAEIAQTAATMTVDAPPALRPRETRRLIGRSVPRLDLPGKVNGSARFGADVRLAGMLFAAVALVDRRPDALSAARGMSGVRHIVEQPGWIAVCADTWWQAHQAAKSLEVPLPPLAAGLDDASITQRLEAALGSPVISDDPADLRARYALAATAAAPLEPLVATARVFGDAAEIWAPTQSVTLVAWAAARALGLRDKDVTVFPTLVGGGFGRKIEVDAVTMAALCARATNAPVQVQLTREQDMALQGVRPAVLADVSGRLSDAGTVAAWQARFATQSAPKSLLARTVPDLKTMAPSGGMPADTLAQDYTIPKHRLETTHIDLPVRGGAARATEQPAAAFARESFLDELALRAQADPAAFRLAHLPQGGRARRVLEAVLARANYQADGLGAERGQGLALHCGYGSVAAAVLEVELRTDQAPRLVQATLAVDCGDIVHPDIVRAQMMGGFLYGLSDALYGHVGYRDGRVTSLSFDRYPLLALADAPPVDIVLLPSVSEPGGVGELATPLAAPALANAIARAGGGRIRALPIIV